MADAQFTAPGIDCEGCARSITSALGRVPGVDQVSVDVSAKRVQVRYDGARLDEARLRDELEGAGFAVAD